MSTSTPLPESVSSGSRPPAANPIQIATALELLCEPGAVHELRALNTSRGTVSGYFDDQVALAKAATRITAAGVYVTLNPVKPELLARASNRVEAYAKHTSSDCDIVKRRWLLIDVDPTRASGISSTDTQHEAALACARRIRNYLTQRGWAAPIIVDSGNGAHLFGRIDLPNDAAASALVKRVLEALAMLFDDDMVSVDCSCFNAARIAKIPGTVASKGDSTADRPHRISKMIEGPGSIEVVTREQRGDRGARTGQPASRAA